MCEVPEEYKKFFILEFQHWRVELHGNQCYLGRCVVVLKRHVEDLTEIDNKEQKELFEVLKKVKIALSDAFGPDLLNYESLGNEVRHLHIHIIPRYSTPKKFAGINFIDERWGHNPSPYNKDFTVSDEVYTKIISEIQSKLE
jgi:diadenosine tetraphosphate (Ap4A) HIT family hydrolase